MKIYFENTDDNIPGSHISHPGSNAATVNKAKNISYKFLK